MDYLCFGYAISYSGCWSSTATVSVPLPCSGWLQYRLPHPCSHTAQGLSVQVWRNYNEFIAELTKRFPHEAGGIRKFYGECWAVFNALNSLEMKSLEEPKYLMGEFFKNPLACLTLASYVATNTGGQWAVVMAAGVVDVYVGWPNPLSLDYMSATSCVQCWHIFNALVSLVMEGGDSEWASFHILPLLLVSTRCASLPVIAEHCHLQVCHPSCLQSVLFVIACVMTIEQARRHSFPLLAHAPRRCVAQVHPGPGPAQVHRHRVLHLVDRVC